MCNQEQYLDTGLSYRTLKRRTGCKHTEPWGLYHRGKTKTRPPPPEPHTNPSPRQPPPTVQPGLFTRRKGVSKSRQTEPPPKTWSPPTQPQPRGWGQETKVAPWGPFPGPPQRLGLCYSQVRAGGAALPKNNSPKSRATVTTSRVFPTLGSRGRPYNSTFLWFSPCRGGRRALQALAIIVLCPSSPSPARTGEEPSGSASPGARVLFFCPCGKLVPSLPSGPLHSRPKHGRTFPHSPLTEASWLKALEHRGSKERAKLTRGKAGGGGTPGPGGSCGHQVRLKSPIKHKNAKKSPKKPKNPTAQ
ncbi:serine/arginine repetitive matrix protein 1-like [Manacus candei]|uniref:serine/arginine repetitive matrix protein 1-like n=1 Tax=Manacus candei TaxID=415023 RepID=UPI002226B996|nr:serine/arginine repetitive matrix protein 1-like [Manacus candei]